MKLNEVPSLPYSDWFGKGDTKQDIEYAAADKGEPQEIMINGNMACLIYSDEIIVCGYDGNEYCHEFVFKREKQTTTGL